MFDLDKLLEFYEVDERDYRAVNRCVDESAHNIANDEYLELQWDFDNNRVIGKTDRLTYPGFDYQASYQVLVPYFLYHLMNLSTALSYAAKVIMDEDICPEYFTLKIRAYDQAFFPNNNSSLLGIPYKKGDNNSGNRVWSGTHGRSIGFEL